MEKKLKRGKEMRMINERWEKDLKKVRKGCGNRRMNKSIGGKIIMEESGLKKVEKIRKMLDEG